MGGRRFERDLCFAAAFRAVEERQRQRGTGRQRNLCVSQLRRGQGVRLFTLRNGQIDLIRGDSPASHPVSL